MTVRRVLGPEVEYGIAVPGHVDMVTNTKLDIR
jgi:hypothetical protein